ncbi:MAG: hypothetical protein EA379_01300 [Phycisphaerales bacterium]|nr:MAG: hypothetical protein EA379_01300 [Phycisphaerales bacterium]
MSCEHGNGNGKTRWAAPALAGVLALIAFTVQWGVVNTRLDGVEKRLDELLMESGHTRNAIITIERRVAFIEGAAAVLERGGRQ